MANDHNVDMGFLLSHDDLKPSTNRLAESGESRNPRIASQRSRSQRDSLSLMTNQDENGEAIMQPKLWQLNKQYVEI